jgi:hypothetical protein
MPGNAQMVGGFGITLLDLNAVPSPILKLGKNTNRIQRQLWPKGQRHGMAWEGAITT